LQEFFKIFGAKHKFSKIYSKGSVLRDLLKKTKQINDLACSFRKKTKTEVERIFTD
jgi:hypothetical protein